MTGDLRAVVGIVVGWVVARNTVTPQSLLFFSNTYLTNLVILAGPLKLITGTEPIHFLDTFLWWRLIWGKPIKPKNLCRIYRCSHCNGLNLEDCTIANKLLEELHYQNKFRPTGITGKCTVVNFAPKKCPTGQWDLYILGLFSYIPTWTIQKINYHLQLEVERTSKN